MRFRTIGGRLRSAALMGIAALLLASSASASHFRGGHMSVSISPDGTLTVVAETLWRKGGNQFSTFPLGGVTRTGFVGTHIARLQILNGNTRAVLRDTNNATLPVPNIIATTTSVDTSDPFFDIRRQRFTYSMPGLGLGFGTYILYWTDTARIAGLNNVNNSGQAPWSLEARFIYDGTARNTPSIASRVITVVGRGQLYSNNLNASGDSALTYGFVVGSFAPRYGPSSQIPGITVNAFGQVEIPAASTATLNPNNLANQPGGDYVFKVLIRDAAGQYMEQDVLLDVVQTPNRACTIAASSQTPTVVVGQTLILTITATDPDVLDQLTISAFPPVANATLQQVGDNPAVATYEFTPDGSQGDTVIGVNFTAADNRAPSLACTVNVRINVLGFLLKEENFDHCKTNGPLVGIRDGLDYPAGDWECWLGSCGACQGPLAFMSWKNKAKINFVKPSILDAFDTSTHAADGQLTMRSYDGNGNTVETLGPITLNRNRCDTIQTGWSRRAAGVEFCYSRGADMALDNLVYRQFQN